MREIKFRAVIDETTVVSFTLENIVNPQPIFSIRELVIPWLRQGNKPDEYIDRKDLNDTEIYSGDRVEAMWYGPSGPIIEEGVVYWEDEHASFYIEFNVEHAEPMSFSDTLEVISNIQSRAKVLSKEGNIH